MTRGLRFFERLSIRLADVVIATNESYRAIDIQRNGADPARRSSFATGRIRSEFA